VLAYVGDVAPEPDVGDLGLGHGLFIVGGTAL